MQELKEKKSEIRKTTLAQRDALTGKQRAEKTRRIMERLFEFANFLEAKNVLFYMDVDSEVGTEAMIRKAMEYEKGIVLPWVDKKEKQIVPLKIEDIGKDVRPGYRGIPEPIPQRCKIMPFELIDLAIMPGIAFDERGGRIGHGTGYYDRLIPKLDVTTRKVALAFECQIVPQIPMEPHDRYIDIIITEDRTIYKI
ncbi:MAG: 5-formyltetrahydrofolate cyclo-ligase [Deltaproteobacteria bacterium]|nr:5-formyltetrahydrofolate cyclo-ligase [Deltaproteobacteria bacterium]